MHWFKYLIISCCVLILGCTLDQKDSDKELKESKEMVESSDVNTQYLSDVMYSLSSVNQGLEERTKSQWNALNKIKTSNPTNPYTTILTALYKDFDKDIRELQELIKSLDDKIATEASMENVGNIDIESTNRFLVNSNDGLRLESKLTDLNRRITSYELHTHVDRIAKNESIDYSVGFIKKFIENFSGNNTKFNLEKNIREAPVPNLYFDETFTESWLEYKFKDVPALGTRTIFAQLTTDLKNLKFHLLSSMVVAAQVSTSSQIYYYPVIQENAVALAPGELFEAQISLGAFDPNASLAGNENIPTEYYVGTYTEEFNQAIAELEARNNEGKMSAGGPNGIAFKNWPFTVRRYQLYPLQQNDMGFAVYNEKAGRGRAITGAVKRGDYWFPFELEYAVETPSNASYLLQKMNVMFAGVSNPIEVSLGGAQVSSASFSCGSVSGSGVSYTIKPSSPGGYEKVCTLTIKGRDKGREVSSSFPVRVRDFPVPAARLKSLPVGDTKMTRGQVCSFSSSSIVATPDENSLAALFDAKFEVLSWDATMSFNGQTPQVIDPVSIAAKCVDPDVIGSTITIYNIKAKAPSGTIMDLAPISYTVK